MGNVYSRRGMTDQAIRWIREFADEKLFMLIHYYDPHADYVSKPEHEKRFVTPYAGDAEATVWEMGLSMLDTDIIDGCLANPEEATCKKS